MFLASGFLLCLFFDCEVTVDSACLLADEMTSPRASQCSHTESLICGMTSPDEAPAGDVLSHVGVPSEASTAPRRHSLSAAAADGQDASDSDVSEPYDGNDLEVNFESEADMLAVETSGDELERSGMATSHDFSELSSQVTAFIFMSTVLSRPNKVGLKRPSVRMYGYDMIR